jgi:hypothetical protein
MSTTYYYLMPVDVTFRRYGDTIEITRGEERVVCAGDLGLLHSVLRPYPSQDEQRARKLAGGGE